MWKRLLYVVAHPSDVSGAPIWQAAAATLPAWRAALPHVLPKLAPPPGATAALVVLLLAALFTKRRKKLASRASTDPRLAPSERGEQPSSPRAVPQQQRSTQGRSEQAQSDAASPSSWSWSSDGSAADQCLPVHPLARQPDAGHGCLRQPQPQPSPTDKWLPASSAASPQAVADSLAVVAMVLLAVGVALLMRRRRPRESAGLDDRPGRPVPTAKGASARDPRRVPSEVAPPPTPPPPPSLTREQRSSSWTAAYTSIQAAIGAVVSTIQPVGPEGDSPSAPRERRGSWSAVWPPGPSSWLAPAAWRPSADDDPAAKSPAGARTKRPAPSPTSGGGPAPAPSRLPRPSTSPPAAAPAAARLPRSSNSPPAAAPAASRHPPAAAPSHLPPPPTRGPKRSPLTPKAEAALAALEAKLEAAFRDCDTDASGNISKRELYRALERLGLKASGSEQLAIWNRIDRDHNNVIDWAEFRRAGLALHDLGELRLNAPYPDVHHAGGHHGAFAAGPTHRTLSDEVRVDEASKSLAVLARRGSEELIRGTMRVLMRGNRPAGR